MKLAKSAVVLTALAGVLGGQEPSPKAVLENNGKPITIPFQCTEDDMQWAGLSCSEEEPCPVYFELAGAEPLGDKIFAAGNLHSDTVTLYSILLASEDEGHTWQEVHPRMRGNGLDRIQFVDLINGWTSGESLFPLPQDPFLLITTDGGKSWRQQPISSEPQPGSIQQFFFSSKDHGSLVIDQGEGSESERYALYETSDGGRTWMVKQLSKRALRLPRTGETTATAWRVQPDRASQSFRIEHRQGERWATAASFAVRAGACKPAAVEAAEPKTEEEPQKAPAPARPGARPGRRPHL